MAEFSLHDFRLCLNGYSAALFRLTTATAFFMRLAATWATIVGLVHGRRSKQLMAAGGDIIVVRGVRSMRKCDMRPYTLRMSTCVW